jgi:hypothetical protein
MSFYQNSTFCRSIIWYFYVQRIIRQKRSSSLHVVLLHFFTPACQNGFHKLYTFVQSAGIDVMTTNILTTLAYLRRLHDSADLYANLGYIDSIHHTQLVVMYLH